MAIPLDFWDRDARHHAANWQSGSCWSIIELERNQGKSREGSIYQACVLRFRLILDDYHGGVARGGFSDARHWLHPRSMIPAQT
jgi:hypothetical protein